MARLAAARHRAYIGAILRPEWPRLVHEVDPSVPPDSGVRPLILAPVLCIDMVLKER